MKNFLSKFGQENRVDVLASDTSPDRCFPLIDYRWKLDTGTRRYIDADIVNEEWEKLWTRQWTLAGFESDLSAVGDYFLYELGHESFIVIRTAPGVIKAFYNVCHHRGSRLLSEPFGRVASICCPFHSWTWNLDGSLRSITDRETFHPEVVEDNPALTPVNVDTWQGMVFINPDDAPQPLMDQLGDLPEILDSYQISDMSVVNDIETLWPVNWKTVLDAFMEGYHAHRRHPELLRYIDDYHFQYDLFANGSSRMIIPVGLQSPRYGAPKLTEEMKQLAEPFGMDTNLYENNPEDFRVALAETKKAWAEKVGMDFSGMTTSQLADDWNINMFPNVTFNAHPEGILIMRYRPHPDDHSQCFYDLFVLARKSDYPGYALPSYMPMSGPDALKTASPRPQRFHAKLGETSFGQVLDQDAETVPGVQQGMRSKAFKGIRFSEQEIRLKHFYKKYNDLMEAK